MKVVHQRALVALLGAGAVVVAVSSGLPTRREDPDATVHVEEATLEVAELADPAVVELAFHSVRAALAGEPAIRQQLARFDGRRVFACAYRVAPTAICAVGEGDDLATSVANAGAALASMGSGWGESVLKLDFEVSSERTRWPAPGFTHGAGEHGLWVERGEARSWLLPSEILERGLYGVPGDDEESRLDDEALRRALIERDPRLGSLDETFAFERIRTTSWVEREPGDGIVRTYRTHAWAQPDLDPDTLLQRAVWAADALADSTERDGRIRYFYDPTRDAVGSGYNLLRHGGSTWSLVSAWARTGHEPWLHAARAAIGFLLGRTTVQERQGPFGGGRTRWVVESSRIKLGGAGLGLLALAEYTAATGDERWLPEAREFATYLLSAQRESGEFVYFAARDPGGEPDTDISAYYPGEAIVGLMRLYAIDKDPRWLETARRGASWLVRVRDAGKTERNLDNDHWLMIGLSRLYAETKDPIWLGHSLALAEAVEHQQRAHLQHVRFHRDYRGGYYEPPRSTPAATRAEGLVAVLDTCKLAGMACEEVRDVLEATVRHELQTQYTPETSWWLASPEAVFGAFYGGIVDPTVRNDYTQHNLSAVLGLERLIRAERGQRVPGDPTWTPEDQRSFVAPTGDELAALRAAGLHFRGTTRWDSAVTAPVMQGTPPLGERPASPPNR